jgi:hypothetical protein
MAHWHEVEDLLRGCARDDVADRGAVRPTLVAFAGARPLLLARWRPFEPTEGHAALSELLTLTTALRGDRLAVAIGATVRLLDEPAGSTAPGARGDPPDALVLVSVEASGGGTARRCTLTPFELERRTGGVLWGRPVRCDSVAGWLVQALAAAVHAQATEMDVGAAALRCLALGHELRSPVTQE